MVPWTEEARKNAFIRKLILKSVKGLMQLGKCFSVGIWFVSLEILHWTTGSVSAHGELLWLSRLLLLFIQLFSRRYILGNKFCRKS